METNGLDGVEVTKGVLARVGDIKEPVGTRLILAFRCPAFSIRDICVLRNQRTKEGNVPILIFVLFINAAHQRSRRRQDLIDEDEDGLLWRQLDALAYNVDKLAYGEIGGYQVLLFIDRCDV